MNDEARRVEQWQAAGLYDPSAPAAADRLAVLGYLHDRGATVEAMLAAELQGSLTGLAGELARWGGRSRITARELSERSGVSLDVVNKVSRAAGLPQIDADEPAFLDTDIEAFRVFATGSDFFGEDSALQFGRVIGAAMASVADAAMSEFGLDVAPKLAEAGAGELERAKAAEFASALLVDQVPSVLQTLFFHHVDAAVRRTQVAGSAVTSHLAVGFLDLVGSTALGERLGPHDLGAALSDFERAATEAIGSRRGRLVKTIGDEVMFVATSSQDACAIAIEVADRVERHPTLPLLRGGLATGGLVRGYGDYYGPVVNTAARIVKIAEPGSILVTEAVRREAEADASGARFVPEGSRELRGMDAVTLFRLERA